MSVYQWYVCIPWIIIFTVNSYDPLVIDSHTCSLLFFTMMTVFKSVLLIKGLFTLFEFINAFTFESWDEWFYLCMVNVLLDIIMISFVYMLSGNGFVSSSKKGFAVFFLLCLVEFKSFMILCKCLQSIWGGSVFDLELILNICLDVFIISSGLYYLVKSPSCHCMLNAKMGYSIMV